MDEAREVDDDEGEGLERQRFEGEAVHGVPRFFIPTEYAIYEPIIGAEVEYHGCINEEGDDGYISEDGEDE